MLSVKSARLKIKKKSLSKNELKEIRELLESASDYYYNTDQMIMDNSEYDYMYNRYIDLGGEPLVGAEPRTDGEDSRVVDTEHKYPKLVGTTLKCHNLVEFNEWIEKTYKTLGLKPKDKLDLYITLKFDGNSILIEYDKNGKVKRALTRGKDGKGKDLSKIFKCKKFSINNLLGVPIAIKYECLLRYSDIPKFADKFGKLYKNPRNGVSGALNGNDGDKYRDFYTLEPLWIDIDSEYKDEVIEENITNGSFKSFRELELNLIDSIYPKSDTIEYLYIFEGNLKGIKDFVADVHDEILSYRDQLDFMIDGMVIDIDADKYREKLGYIINTENPTPKWCVALKFPYMEKESEVEKIEYSVGDSGRISPVCYFKPVTMANGTTHSKQYLQGYKRFKELQLCKGTRILVQLHNDTLSYIERLDTIEDDKREGRTPIKFIDKCPICGEKLSIISNDKGEETFVYCTNDLCQGRSIGRINNFLIKMDIKGIKTSTIEKLHNAGIWNKIEDIFDFDKDKAYTIEGLGKKSIDTMIKSINKKKYYDYEILGSLGIRNFGLDTAKELCKKLSLDLLLKKTNIVRRKQKTLDELNSSYDNGKTDRRKFVQERQQLEREVGMTYYSFSNDLCEVEGIAELLAETIVDGLIKNYDTISFLMMRGYKKLSDEQSFDETLYTFVITGDLEVCGRDQMKKILERHGHKLTSSVSRKTDYLVTNFPKSGTVKIKKAKELGTKIINEKELIELLGYDMNEELKTTKQTY